MYVVKLFTEFVVYSHDNFLKLFLDFDERDTIWENLCC